MLILIYSDRIKNTCYRKSRCTTGIVIEKYFNSDNHNSNANIMAIINIHIYLCVKCAIYRINLIA